MYEMLAERRPDFICGIPGAAVSSADEAAISKKDVGKTIRVVGGKLYVDKMHRDVWWSGNLHPGDLSGKIVHVNEQVFTGTVKVQLAHKSDMSSRDNDGAQMPVPLLSQHSEVSPSHASAACRATSSHSQTSASHGVFDSITIENPYWNARIPKTKLGWKLEELKNHYFKEKLDAGEARLKGDKKAKILSLWERMLAEVNVLFKGPSNDPRDTDNAWLETTALHYHISEERGNMELSDLLDRLPKEIVDSSGNRVAHLVWLRMNRLTEPRYNSLYADHAQLLERVRYSFDPHYSAGRFYSRLREKIVQQGEMSPKPKRYSIAPSIFDKPVVGKQVDIVPHTGIVVAWPTGVAKEYVMYVSHTHILQLKCQEYVR